ncbi:hypothetical protein [Vibrio coralliirubri]|uniref:hypothetical protein n=1 Tax=Vibrio coralliirubri TaxID=1516159 RepID=UPI00073E8DE6|nr:hypothetical protein [Vibrio coralliirubri]
MEIEVEIEIEETGEGPAETAETAEIEIEEETEEIVVDEKVEGVQQSVNQPQFEVRIVRPCK